jgi:protein SCO1
MVSVWLSLWVLGCSSELPTTSHSFTGTVVELRGADVVVIDHDEIPGFMEPMIMPFTVSDAGLLVWVDLGEEVAGTLVVGPTSSMVTALTVTKELAVPAPAEPVERGVAVEEGAMFPRTPVLLAKGRPLTIGEGQSSGGAIALTFIYTRCPIPEYCPLVVSRFQALQEQLPEGARLLAVTMDPDYDTASVLAAFGEEAGAVPGRWDFGRVPKEVLIGVAEKAGLAVHGRGTGISHDLVMVILDAEGRVVRRYRDFAWDMGEVVNLLESSGKRAAPGHPAP